MSYALAIGVLRLPLLWNVVASASTTRGEGLVWLIGAVRCLPVAPRVQLSLPGRTMEGRIKRCDIISSCQSTATWDIVTRLFLSLTHVNSDVASFQTFNV